VSDVMLPIVTILDAEDHVMKAVQAMVALDVNLIPVLQEGKLVGVVRSVDVFHDLAQLVR
jgi:predicted transcriptional regulator